MSQPPRKVIRIPKVRMLSRGGRLSAGVRITNVKSIKPPDPEIVKKQEEEKLRAQLQKEIVGRSKLCANKSYECLLPVIAGRQYCYRHILRDQTAPYWQCAHTHSNGERCTMPAPDDQRDPRDSGLCFEHARAALYARQRSTAPPAPVATTETLLNRLQHYVKQERPRTTSCASSVSVVSDPGEQEQTEPGAIDPFKQMDAIAVNAAYSTSIMECASASDSDADSVIIDPESGPGLHEDLSDAEDAPCEEQPLWRAGVYTAEEAVSEAKNVLKLLQDAYIKQMDRLRVLLHNARLQYVRSLKQEKEQYCSINTQAHTAPLTVKERRQLRKLKAYASYHRKHGVEAVLARKLHRKRAKVNEMRHLNRGVPPHARCTFTDGGFRCPAAVMPASKHCLKHILHDKQQVLFAACGDMRGVTCCREPIAKLPLPSSACRYHTDPPVYTVFTLRKDESDSESDSETTSVGSACEAADMSDERLTSDNLPQDVPLQ